MTKRSSFNTEFVFVAEIKENNAQGQFIVDGVSPCIKRVASPNLWQKKQENGRSYPDDKQPSRVAIFICIYCAEVQ